jgi:hypothetical protein
LGLPLFALLALLALFRVVEILTPGLRGRGIVSGDSTGFPALRK